MRAGGDRWPIYLGLIVASLVVLSVLNPWWILTPTTPTGGDMGAHVFGPAFLRDSLLPEGRLLGWSDDWFAGFPAFYFYFPLPSLTIVALDLFIPYGVAFKIVTVLGLLATPPAAYFLARSMRFGRNMSLIAAGSGVVFAFYESFTIYGGNVASTLAGEFSYSWSFALSLVYLGLLIKAVRDDRRFLKWAALALALTALSHVLTTIIVIFASLFVLPWKKGLLRTLAIWAWGFSIAAFWALPLLARIGLTSDMAWSPLRRWEEIFPVELWLLLPVAIPGAVWAMKKTARVGPLIAATVLPIIYYPLPTLLPELFPETFTNEPWKLWNGRLLPYWYFGVAFFAAVGVAFAVVWLSRRLPARVSSHWPRLLIATATIVAAALIADSTEFPDYAWLPVIGVGIFFIMGSMTFPSMTSTKGFLTAFASSVIVLGALAGVTFVDGWSRWNYEGYENKDPWPEYEALMTELDQLPDGRVQWEGNSGLNKYGTPMSPMLIPYWTEGSQGSMEGLFFESSLTTPFHFINSSEMSFDASNPIPGLTYHDLQMERGIQHLGMYGVDYYVSFTPEAAEKAREMDELIELVEVQPGPFVVFALPETDLVEAAAYLPSVYPSEDGSLLGSLTGSGTTLGSDGEPLPSFHDMALEFHEDVENIDRWVAADGPDDWPRIESIDERPNVLLNVPAGAVTNIESSDHEISFSTTAIGVPHLVKMSYFPNWTAVGADGPWRAAPSLMMVVPTQEDVVIEFRDTWAESGGRILSVIGVIGLVILGVVLVVRNRRRDSLESEVS